MAVLTSVDAVVTRISTLLPVEDRQGRAITARRFSEATPKQISGDSVRPFRWGGLRSSDGTHFFHSDPSLGKVNERWL